MVKTALATNVIERVAKSGGRVLMFTMEMTSEQMAFRIIAQMSDCSYGDVSEGRLTDDEMGRVAIAVGTLSEMSITMVDQAALTVSQIHSRVQREMAIGGVDLVVVDYLQLLSSDTRYNNRSLEVGAFSQGLKRLALSVNVPVVALAQLSRAVEKRENKRPTLTDLRDSGEIEQSADVVMFLFRADYYPDDYDEDDDILPGSTELSIMKNRFGATGVVDLMFSAHCGRFDSKNPGTMYEL